MSDSPDTFPDLHPNAYRALTIDWTKDLGPTEKIASCVWTYEGDGGNDTLVLDRDSIDASGKKTTIWAKQGTDGCQYRIKAVGTTDTVPPQILTSVKLLNIRSGAR